jgi:hypothetical protein
MGKATFMLVEGVITLIIVAAMFYVAPGVLGSVKSAAPLVLSTAGTPGLPVDAALNASQTTIATTVSGGLNLSAISMIMLGIGLMIGGFMLIRGQRQY